MLSAIKLLVNLYFLVYLLTHRQCHAKSQLNNISFYSFDFEQIKNQFFFDEDFQSLIQNHYDDDEVNSKSNYDDNKCVIEMIAIKESLQNFERWALELLDSWGKLPSAILSGNFYEFGGFAQCFHVERNDKPYETQYCLGQLIIDLKNIAKPKQYYADNASNLNNWRTGNELGQIMPRIALPKPKEGQAINFGVCLPKVCSPLLFEVLLNHLIEEKFQNITIKIPEGTCQFEQNITQIESSDWITIVLLATVLCLIVASTCYDIHCTMSNKQKVEALLAFSAYTNGIKLLSYKISKSADMMNCLHGIRAISTQWVVLGHSFVMFLFLPIRNKIDYVEFVSQYHNMIVMSGLISVDTFFVMSGLLVSVNMLKHMEKTHGRINILTLYVHRYLRLTPLLAISVLFTTTLLRFLGNGPLWPSYIQFFSEQCERNWWSTLLYIQNYVNSDDICFGHSWYLSVDTQLFFIAPFVMYTIYRFKAKAIYCLSLLVVGCVVCTIATFLKHDFAQSGLDGKKMELTYYATHIRFSPWLIGVFGGYILHQSRKRSIRIPRILNLFAWIVSLALMLTVIFANYPLMQPDRKATALEHGLYESLSRVAWAIALCYIIFACVHNYGGPVNWFLSHPLWQPISRLCYSIYLIHFPIILIIQATMKTAPYFSELTAFHAFIGNYIITVFFSVIASLAFESPIVTIEKLIFGNRKPRPEEPKPSSSTDQINGTQIENGKL